MDAEGNP